MTPAEMGKAEMPTRCLVCGHQQDAPVWYLWARPGRSFEDGQKLPRNQEDVGVWGDGSLVVSCEEHPSTEVRTAFVLQEPYIRRLTLDEYFESRLNQ